MTTLHPEHPQEQAQLHATIQEITRQAAELETRYDDSSGGDAWADYCIAKVIGTTRQRGSYLREHLDKPYFSRLTFMDDGSLNDIYLGRYSGQYGGAQIVDWRAPVGQLLQPHASRVQTYTIPAGKSSSRTRSVLLHRKRSLDIEQRRINAINDLIRYNASATVDENELFHFSELNEEFLLSRLGNGSDKTLKDIV